jgi:predicted metal-dependent phosphoesterase TrpH
MKALAADLHIHTGLSPCAADEMTPPAIVQAALERGLAMIAICDHNAAGNTAATLMAGWGKLAVLAGMEITTAEEVHVVGIFPGPISALAAADEVLETLPDADDAYYRRFGRQRFMNADGRITRTERKMLSAASTLDLGRTVALIHRHQGLAIAAHVNRPSFSVLSQLGLFPAEAGFDAAEVFTPGGDPAVGRAPDPAALAAIASLGLPVLASSDSHSLADIGSVRTMLELREPTFDELVRALRGEGGRAVRAGKG